MRSIGHQFGVISVRTCPRPMCHDPTDNDSHQATRFMIGTTVAIPAASLCINRRLYNIASIKAVTISRKEKQHGIMIDLAIGLGIPILEMILRECVAIMKLLSLTSPLFQNTSCRVIVSIFSRTLAASLQPTTPHRLMH